MIKTEGFVSVFTQNYFTKTMDFLINLFFFKSIVWHYENISMYFSYSDVNFSWIWKAC